MTARNFDVNGWYEIPQNPLSKSGVFPFRGSSINGPDPNAMYSVYRPPEELSAQDTLNSLRLLPWIKKHAMLAGNTPATQTAVNGYVPPEQKGVHGVIGENVFYDPQCGTVFGNIKCFSSTLSNDIEQELN